MLTKRHQHGAYYHLVRELELDGDRFCDYFRLTREQFKLVLHQVELFLVKHCLSRETLVSDSTPFFCFVVY